MSAILTNIGNDKVSGEYTMQLDTADKLHIVVFSLKHHSQLLHQKHTNFFSQDKP